MLIEAKSQDFAALLRGQGPAPFRLCDSPVAPLAVLEMLAGLAERIGQTFRPSAWMMVEDGQIVGLISPTRPLTPDGALRVGYGVAPTRWGRGVATRAVANLAAWAKLDPRVTALTAETSVHNPASQTVLTRNGFQQAGEREDREDGRLILWRLDL